MAAPRRIATVILIVHACLLAYSGWTHSPTVGETAYLPAGLSHWRLGTFEQARMSPPLLRMVAALPVLWLEPEYDWTESNSAPGAKSEVYVGNRFVQLNGPRLVEIFAVARWACIPFSLLGGWICYRWASELYGLKSGLLALVLWSFCPNVLGHASCVTPDIVGAATGLLAAYMFWKWLIAPGWYYLLAAGLSLGVAELSRSTWVVLVPIWVFLWLVFRIRPMYSTDNSRCGKPSLFGLIGIMVLALYVLNAGYGFIGSGKKLGDFEFVSATLNGGTPFGNRFASSWAGRLPVPLPRDYVMGIDVQKRDFESWNYPSYCGGTVSARGWWYYYLYGLGLKLPLGLFVLVLASCFVGLDGGTSDRTQIAAICIWVTIATVVVLVSVQTEFSAHIRYSFGILPFLYVWASRVARLVTLNFSWYSRAMVVATIWFVLSSIYQYPHSLSYFNELAGGPRNGYMFLVDSNLDWGQDLWYLKEWTEQHPDHAPLFVDCYGSAVPQTAGIRSLQPRRGEFGKIQLLPGYYAISATCLQLPPEIYEFFREQRPIDRIAYSILVYRVPEVARDRNHAQPLRAGE